MTQPFKTNEKLIVEKRDKNGKLLMDGKQPLSWMMDTSLDKLYKWAFSQPEHKTKNTLSFEELKQSLDKYEWTVRTKTW